MTWPAYYILDSDGKLVEVDLLTWGRWMQELPTGRIIKQDLLPSGVKVSTVFLGLDHRFWGTGLPILFETMIFGGEHDGYMERYCSKEDALLGHWQALELVTNSERIPRTCS